MIDDKTKYKFLYASALYVSKEPAIVKTVLGSCVSVCLFDEVNKIGGINHFMLPYWKGNELSSPKFGNVAMKKLVDKMIYCGANKNSIVAKIFGGAETLNYQNCQFKIGNQNIEMARSFLKEADIPIASSDTGGKYGRKITFTTATGMVISKKIIPECESEKCIVRHEQK